MTTYTGSLALRLAGAEELLARSARFRQKVGAGNVLEAKDKVYCGELTDLLNIIVAGGTLDVVRPSAIIGVEHHSYVQIGQGAQIELGANGVVWVLFTDKAQDPTNHKLSLFDFADWTSQVTDEISDLMGRDVQDPTSTLWPYNSMRMFLEPYRPDLADRQADDYWLSGYVLMDNIDGGG